MRRSLIAASISGLIAGSLALPAAAAGMVVYKDGDKYVKFGGRIQLQYHQVDPDSGEKTDEIFFRRLRPYIEGSLHKDWKAKIQFDIGKADGDNELAVKDAYMQYKGFDGMKVTLGNVKAPFSREFLTSSKKQQLVERTFVGDHNYGSPDRSLGLHLAGEAGMITWGASFSSAAMDPDAKKLDFDSPANNIGDWNEGWLYGGRVDIHPFGKVKFEQGDFSDGAFKLAVGLAAFGWDNDDDNNTYTDAAGVSTSGSKADIDSVTGYEIGAAIRVAGLSVDIQYNNFDTDTVDTGFTGGLFRNGTTELETFAIEGGYMVIPSKLELVAGFEQLDADNYAEVWERQSLGVNYFFHKYDAKVQLTYRMNEDKDGIEGNDEDELFLQTQFVF